MAFFQEIIINLDDEKVGKYFEFQYLLTWTEMQLYTWTAVDMDRKTEIQLNNSFGIEYIPRD